MQTILSEEFTSRMYVPRHDMHIHTCYCNHTDEDATFENYINFATEMGMLFLGFAEHVWDQESAALIDLIRQDVETMEMPEGAPTILIGAEVDADPYQPDGRPLAGELTVELDYVVLAAHHGLRLGQPRGESIQVGKLTEAEREYYGDSFLDWYQACIESGNYDIMAHLLRSAVTGGLISFNDRKTFARVAELLRLAAVRGMVLELNCGWNFYLMKNDCFESFIELMQDGKANGLKFCISSDAHAMDHFWTTDLESEDQVTTNLSPIGFIEAAGLEETDWLDPEVFLDRRAREAEKPK